MRWDFKPVIGLVWLQFFLLLKKQTYSKGNVILKQGVEPRKISINNSKYTYV
jgi:hypothetical protein